MPKVLRILNRLNLGGPTYNAAYLTKYLAPEFETILLAGKKDESEESSEFIVNNLDIEPTYIKNMKRSINPLKDIKAYFEIKKLIKKFKPDIVHTHASKAGFVGRLAAIHCKVPIIVHTFHGHVFHSYFNPLITRIFIKIERYLAKRSTIIISLSELQKKELSETFKICSPNKISIIPLGFELDRFQKDYNKRRKAFREKYKLEKSEIVIGIIGRLVPIKNHSLFLEAIKYAKANTNKRIKAFIIGDGEERDNIEKQVNSLGLSDIVIFTSWIKNVEEAYPGLDIVMLTSLNEGTPVSLIEAQASNTPIISTRIGGIENIVNENETALLADTSKESQLYQHLLTLIGDNNLRKTMSTKGNTFVKEKFSRERLVQDIKELYNNRLNN